VNNLIFWKALRQAQCDIINYLDNSHPELVEGQQIV